MVEPWTPASGRPPGRPLHATRRDLSRPTLGPRIAVVAEAMGTPLLPWQRYAADVATEVMEDGSFAYRIVVITVPRQSGKTVLIRAAAVERCISDPDQFVFYTAQSGKDAKPRWEDTVKALRRSPIKSQFDVRYTNGAEKVRFHNGSEFGCFAPVEDALHGYTPPLVFLDEAMAYDEELGNALLAAILPAQVTLRRRQLWIVSTAGTAKSAFLRKMLALGRAGEPSTCLIEYGIPEGEDVYSPDVWRRRHPAFDENGEPHLRPDGSPQVTVEAIQTDANVMPTDEFVRGYGNRETLAGSTLIAGDVWAGLRSDLDGVKSTEVVVSCDVAFDRSAATITAVWRAGDRVAGKVLMRDVGYAWCAPAIDELCSASAPIAVAIADNGPSREVADRLQTERARSRLRLLAERDYSLACGAFLRMVADSEVTHDGDPELAAAVAGLVTRPSGDGISFSRRHSVGDVSPAIAYVVGAFAYDHRPAVGKPVVAFRAAS